MKTKKVFAYIRVSTKKQGEHGVSLSAQRRLLKEYAIRHNLQIIKWFEEMGSASKGKRPLFNQMLKELDIGISDGILAHKIDRLMRNQMDWARLNTYMDNGTNIYLADGTRMDDVNGRFMGDIQASVATRYSRNLAQEAKKGIYQRLHDGIYPFRAPVGYRDSGRGKIKTIDPIKGPLIKKCYDLYINHKFSIERLVNEMYRRGLRNTKERKVTKNGIIKILSNPFYYGIMRIKGENYIGKHEKLISYKTFLKAKSIREGKTNTKVFKHDFLFRKMLTCKHCSYKLIGEIQKGNTYYRCHTKGCPTKSVRENYLDYSIEELLRNCSIQDTELTQIETYITQIEKIEHSSIKEQKQSLNLRIGNLNAHLDKIRALLIDGVLDKEEYIIEKEKTIAQRQQLLEEKDELSDENTGWSKKVEFFLELAKNLVFLYDRATLNEKRELLKILSSNLYIEGKKLMFSTLSPMVKLMNRELFSKCDLNHTTALTNHSTIAIDLQSTSLITPTSLSGEQCKNFAEYLVREQSSLPNPNDYHAIQTNYPNTK